MYDSKAQIFLYKHLAKSFCKVTVCLSSVPAKWSNESMKNSATDNYLSWHSAKAQTAIRTGQTTSANCEKDVLLKIIRHQRFSKFKEDTFGFNDTDHFDQTDFFREDLGNASCESYGLDGDHTSQNYQISEQILLKEPIHTGLAILPHDNVGPHPC
ncbi:hypothetical protein Y032_0006g2933 [Ancylostoma ceylanicum]|uniref:Uncharacterized protein n=1 Tax=Ancylostoma ceylanicum TaxID=53326 RepID=A0A016VPL1_9BILA|nr:hypothetical protein Y032_0006g2933 [Ancylostoma ceylanicum]